MRGGAISRAAIRVNIAPQALARWNFRAHQELQGFVNEDLRRVLWTELATAKLYLRVDDIESVVSLCLSRLLERSEKEVCGSAAGCS